MLVVPSGQDRTRSQGGQAHDSCHRGRAGSALSLAAARVEKSKRHGIESCCGAITFRLAGMQTKAACKKRGPGRVGPSPHLPPVLAAVLRKNAETLSILLVRDLAACIALGEHTLG